MEISSNFYNYLKFELAIHLDKRKSISTDFVDALALGDEIENAPLDFARQAREINENKIRDIEWALQYHLPHKEELENILLIGSLFKAKSITTGEVITLILTTPELTSLMPSGFKAISTSTPLGQAALGKKLSEQFGNYIILSVEKY